MKLRRILRRKAEEDLRRSERDYRYLYHNTPAMLHSIDTDYRMIQVSDFWLEATGYTREEVLGCRLTDFLTPSSREYAETTILPHFFRTGTSREVSYELVRKDGSVMDILLTCNAIRDDSGEITHTLAVSVDVTQRKKEQEELQRAKEKLDEYSRELEHRVNQRSQEIAESYHISGKTVDTHRQSILKKLGLRNNADISRFAHQHNII